MHRHLLSLVHLTLFSSLFSLSLDSETSPRQSRISNRKGALVARYRNYRQQKIIAMSEAKKLIVLVSNGCHDRTQSSNQEKAQSWFLSRKVPMIIVDGMDANQREKRNELFEISGIRGNYPQFFFEDKEGSISFFGSFEKIEQLNETSGLPAEVLAQHPEIETWEKVFGSVVDSFE